MYRHLVGEKLFDARPAFEAMTNEQWSKVILDDSDTASKKSSRLFKSIHCVMNLSSGPKKARYLCHCKTLI